MSPRAAKRCGQYYVNHRWLGGMLTNWKTITGSIKRLRQIEDMLAGDTQGLTKKEVLDITRDRDKLERALGGIKEMGGLPDILFIIDTNKEKLAVEEATKLGIPVVAVLDSNSDPTGVTYPIPGNDDAIRAITLYCDLVAGAVLDGISAEMAASGRDIGEPPRICRPSALPRAGPTTAPTAAEPAGRTGRGAAAERSGGRRAMAEITAALVKDLREKTGAGHDGLQAGADRDRRRHRGGGRLAAQEGAVGGGQEVRPRRRRGADRHRLRPRPRGDGRGQCRDRFRRPQRDFSGVRRERRRSWRWTSARIWTRSGRRGFRRGRSVADELTQLVATIGENMTLRRARVLEAPGGVVATYVHGALRPGLGKIGVLVAVAGKGEFETLETLGRQVGMHVAASRPEALDIDAVDPAALERERAVLQRTGAHLGQAGRGDREDGRWPHPQILRGSGAAGAGLGA